MRVRNIAGSRVMDDRKWLVIFALGAMSVVAGCAVPQRPGNGKCMRLIEGTTQAGYWLYLPEEYVKNDGDNPAGGRWPLVMTFHGMKPYDNANPQIREWQQEADRYGFIVCAPELRTCDSFMQFPLADANLSYVKRDEQVTLAIMDEIFRRTQADPGRVLSTSWSSGGYMAHFMVNRYPERFSCIAVRQSNFSSEMMDPGQIAKYRDMKIAIFFGENDFAICRKESTEAVAWYRQHRFDVTAKYVGGLGHERTPQTAAMFFAQGLGIEPRTPPPIGTLVMNDVMPERTSSANANLHREPGRTPIPPRRPDTLDETNAIFPDARSGSSGELATAAGSPSQLTVADVSPSTPQRHPTRYQPPPQTAQRSPARSLPLRTGNVDDKTPARLRLSTTVGVTPLWVSYRVDLPAEVQKGSSVLWTDNGRPISTAMNGYCVMRDVGQHRLEALIITQDDREIRLSETVEVLPKLATTRPTAQNGG